MLQDTEKAIVNLIKDLGEILDSMQDRITKLEQKLHKEKEKKS
jgi:hypothetical protein